MVENPHVGLRERKSGMHVLARQLVVLLTPLLVASSAAAATELTPGASEFKVEMPRELRMLAGRGQLSPVAHALVMVAVPPSFDATRDWPVMVVSATSDVEYRSSRDHLRAYADTALSHGWIVIAADAEEEVAPEQDDVPLRYALNKAAFGALQSRWQRADRARLAFGGFSGGAKYSGWLAAAFAKEGRSIIGIYLAGVNQDTITPAARLLDLDESFQRVPIFLQSGETDDIATMADHQRVQNDLKHAGFRNVRIEYFPGRHILDPRPLGTALDWFLEVAAQTTPR